MRITNATKRHVQSRCTASGIVGLPNVGVSVGVRFGCRPDPCTVVPVYKTIWLPAVPSCSVYSSNYTVVDGRLYDRY